MLVQENLDYFQAEEESQHWRNYIDYLDDVVLDGLFECVQCSLLYLKENTDKDKEMPPLMFAKLELQVNIAFNREYYLGEGGGGGRNSLIHSSLVKEYNDTFVYFRLLR